jgi:threonine aldolase
MANKLMFASDYQEGAHENIIRRMVDTNLISTSGYGTDEICASARDKIRKACNCPDARVEFLVGGTQTNATVIASILRPYEGVIAADSGHINVHEAGAIEYTGHKVIALPGADGKLSAATIADFLHSYEIDENRDHTVKPGMVYVSQTTEYGTIYSKSELTAISQVCRQHNIPLYLDGARLAYALACPENDITLADLAKLCDVFYIGGTKCGALFGEAVVIPDSNLIPHFFTMIKQHGALLAKGRLLGIQFDELFTNNLYEEIGQTAISYAREITEALREKGYRLYLNSPSNQIFFIIENDALQKLSQQVEYSYIEKYDNNHSVIRFATSWATTAESVQALISIL